MSKWKRPNEHSVVIDDENGYLGAAEGSLAARDLVANHNADIDALQAKLDAAEAIITRLREVVPQEYDNRRFCANCKRLTDACYDPLDEKADDVCAVCDHPVYDLEGNDDIYHDTVREILYPRGEVLCEAHNATLDAATQPGIVWNYDIEEAPKDGTRVLVAETWGGGRIHIAAWIERGSEWITDDETFIGVEHAVAWAPLNWPEVAP